ncbi:MAG: ATP synthase F1 subunit gamma [Phycisphaeraceae bacterium]|nr:ATP synthase F1 subunit gamma [Phycisphaerae bacterium]MBX3391532.1 ATP synthase F1 subunit gamma [Phycisphaeraceae bacterium]HRJ50215.1 ATP synthase F1 subunit gamma [Phycisphaerales bacterium]
MAKTREIKKRIKAVGNIRRITKTMQMIATSKFARSQQAAMASKPYSAALFSLVGELSSGTGDVSHPLVNGTQAEGARDLTLIITSDRGLCGPYNGSVLRASMALLRGNPGLRDGEIELVGKKGAGFLKFNRIPVSRQHSQFGDKVTYEKVEALAQEYIDRFSAGQIKSVRVVFMKYLSAARQMPETLQLLPFKPPARQVDSPEKGYDPVYEFSPDAGELLNHLLPAAVKATLFQSFNDAVVSEHVARMVAMKSATDNAGKAGKRYTRIYNRARQAQITTELTEIISGAAALA